LKIGDENMIGKKIKEYLNKKGISQTFVSNKTGIPISTLNAALNGNRKILAEEYFIICQVLEVPLDTFVEDKDVEIKDEDQTA
jgi:transcriptional regulator with XRE-family HTH domain